jgi:hypothetical protein
MALVHVRGFDARLFFESCWLWPYRSALQGFANHEAWPSFAELETLLSISALRAGHNPLKLALAPPKKKKRKRHAPVALQSLYDVRINELCELPTRHADWHDFFNVLAFVAWPRAKRALHARQARLLRARLPDPVLRLPGERTREQDVLTMFDEGGVVLACTASEYRCLVEGDVLDATVASLCEASAVRVAPFGHALAEHIVAGVPCPLAYAHVVCLPSLEVPEDALLDALDRELARALSDPMSFVSPSGVRGLSLEQLTHVAPSVQKLVRP